MALLYHKLKAIGGRRYRQRIPDFEDRYEAKSLVDSDDTMIEIPTSLAMLVDAVGTVTVSVDVVGTVLVSVGVVGTVVVSVGVVGTVVVSVALMTVGISL